ncbi:GNAT family N-acetyltransferase [Pseudomonas sp. X10]
MTNHAQVVTQANEKDLDGILDLQARNQVERGGLLAASLPPERILAMMREMPLIVARRGTRVTGFLLTATRQMNADFPLVKAMLEAYPGPPDAYIYGPICVSEEERGQGLAQRMFAHLCQLEPGREGILFIRKDNEASMHAHLKMGMQEVATFLFDDHEFAVFSYRG